MSSLRLKALNALATAALRPRLTATPSPQVARREFERATRIFLRPPPNCLVLSDPEMDWVSVGPPAGEVLILYFHGGAYLVGSPRTHRALAGRIAALSGLRVALPSYPLAPENPAPAAFEAALAAWDLVVARGYASDRIVLGGDSAGGGLALALLAHLIKTGAAPAGLFAYSPWTDLTGSGGTIAANTAHDRLFDPQRLAEVIGYVTSNGAFPADDPRLSPYFADFQAPPPVWMSVARSEILLDDTLRIAGKLRAGGGVVTVAELPDAPHVWPLFDGFLPEARATISASAAFARACLSLPPMR